MQKYNACRPEVEYPLCPNYLIISMITYKIQEKMAIGILNKYRWIVD
jgi:hypothetical protein